MARNIEIKASVGQLTALREAARRLATGPGQVISQTDTFFRVSKGRLKLREFGDGSAELIAYHRPNQTGPKESIYTRVASKDPAGLRRGLEAVLDVRGRVVKRREVFMVGRTRVHLDEVEHLGSFVELEVVLDDGESTKSGEEEARSLMDALGILPSMLVQEAYIDLLEAGA